MSNRKEFNVVERCHLGRNMRKRFPRTY